MSRLPSGPLLAIALALASAGLARAEAARVDEPVWLLQSGKAEDAERAAKLYEARAADNPQSYEAHIGVAQALTQAMAIRSNGNLPLVDGLQDSDANRKLWADLGKRSLEHARAAYAIKPQSADAAALLASSYMFWASSLGIIQSILSGAGTEYRTHAQRLVELDATYDDALGDTLLASFYLVAPWPVGDREQALEHYERAAKLAPESVRNQYGLGVYWARGGDHARSRGYFEHVVAMPCTAHTEKLFCDWMKKTSQLELARQAGD
jgi:tetratricopeptide (TPR) repeat protein